MSALIAEAWTWFALTVVVVMARILSRRMLYGSFTRMGIDDYLMLFALVAYTILVVGVDILTKTPTNLINPDEHVDLTPENIKRRIFGSKMVVVVEQMQITLVWSVKACLLLMYSRLTSSLKQNIVILSAILNKYYSFSDNYGTAWIFWYIREASTAIIVANLPLTWTLLQGVFALRSFHGKSSPSNPTGGERGTAGFRSQYGGLNSRTHDNNNNNNRTMLRTARDRDRRRTGLHDTELGGSPAESQENIILEPLKIYQRNEFHVTTEEVGRGGGGGELRSADGPPSGTTFAVNGGGVGAGRKVESPDGDPRW
ncbi:hypothetical protein GGR56DRAFT_692531 [Xylariaceae sp. FL0804]|nr:hypothetical protein GGR56DRAFT_692531 [Xylariaceae sp. FL0804]